ncbi:hypothetical protein H4219_002154 [Mycoemilia scoparia]|uniref:Inositol polyphosphate-related phosphatase domain-containing protein n=1 Tax=Mycoemilia scoparia TaxID=417184 RepID=A0A9W8DUT9_9FUNG|nr:hypothetical protein H4219_002154 [Mycoemilia scoparia]
MTTSWLAHFVETHHVRLKEKCRFAINALWHVKDNTKIPVTVAIVTNDEKEAPEACVILFVQDVNTVFIAMCFPIYSTTTVRVNLIPTETAGIVGEKGDTQDHERGIEIFNTNQYMDLEVMDHNDVELLWHELRRYVDAAKEWSLLSGGGTHQWVDFYVPSRNIIEILRNENVSSISTRDHAHSIPISSSAGSLRSIESMESSNSSSAGSTGINTQQQVNRINHEIKEALLSMSEPLEFKIWVGTWNVNEKLPPKNLSEWMDFLPKEHHGSSSSNTDTTTTSTSPPPSTPSISTHNPVYMDDRNDIPKVLVFGIQELDMSSSSFVYHDQTKEQEWYRSIDLTLGSLAGSYSRIISKRLVGMLIIVYVHKSIRHAVLASQKCQVNCGFMGLGNKGAVSARLRICGCSITFICAHLAAHQGPEYAKERNRQAHLIFDKIHFEYANQDKINPSTLLYNVIHADRDILAAQHKAIKTSRSDIVMFFGDLNYRINTDADNIYSLIKSGDRKELLKYDEMLNEQRPDGTFGYFNESPINFDPTFKVVVGKSEYNPQRSPAWTDRILWATKKFAQNVEPWFKISNVSYNSHVNINTSDHKPVSAIFSLETLAVNHTKYDNVLSEILRKIDQDDSQPSPQIELSETDIKLGSINLHNPIIKTVSLKNTGDTDIKFEFIPKPGEVLLFSSWFHVSPVRGYIPAHSDVTLQFMISVRGAVHSGSIVEGNLRDWVILQVDNRKLLFITIGGECQESCFGTSIEKLWWPFEHHSAGTMSDIQRSMTTGNTDDSKSISLVNKHMQSLQEIYNYRDDDSGDLMFVNNNDTQNESLGVSVIPRQITKLVEFLIAHAQDSPNLFIQPGDPTRINYIYSCIDDDRDIDPELLFGPKDNLKEFVPVPIPTDELESLIPQSAIPSASAYSMYTPLPSTSALSAVSTFEYGVSEKVEGGTLESEEKIEECHHKHKEVQELIHSFTRPIGVIGNEGSASDVGGGNISNTNYNEEKNSKKWNDFRVRFIRYIIELNS